MMTLTYTDTSSIATQAYEKPEPRSIASEGENGRESAFVARMGFRLSSLPHLRRVAQWRFVVPVTSESLEILPFAANSAITMDSTALNGSIAGDEYAMSGLVILKHPRRVLFSDEVELRVSELPRRRPRINLDGLPYDLDD